MATQTVLIVDDVKKDREVLADHLGRCGYRIAMAGTIAEAELAAGLGVYACVLDVKMRRKPDDHSGLLAIKKVRKTNPNALIIVSSVVASQYEDLARALGADEVITKNDDRVTTAIDIENHILRHHREKEFNALRRILFLIGEWAAIPLMVGIISAVICWKINFQLFFLSSKHVAKVLIELAFLFILIVMDKRGGQDPVISAWPVFVLFRRFRLWFLAAISSGLVYDALKNPIVEIVLRLARQLDL